MPRRRRKSLEDTKGDLLAADRPKKGKKSTTNTNEMDKFKSSLGDLCKNESNLSLLSSKISSLLTHELKGAKKPKKRGAFNSILNNLDHNQIHSYNESEQMKFLNSKKDIFCEENLNAFKMKLFQQNSMHDDDGDLDDDGEDDESKDSILGSQNNNSQLNMVESFLSNPNNNNGNLNMESHNSLQMIQNQLNEQTHSQLPPFHVASDNSFNINSIVRNKDFVAPSSTALLNSGLGLIQSKGSKKWIDSMNSDQSNNCQANQNSLMNRDFLARLMMNGCNPQNSSASKFGQNLNEEQDDDSSTILDVVDSQNPSNHHNNNTNSNLENQFSNNSNLQEQMNQMPNLPNLPSNHSNFTHNLPHHPLHQSPYSGQFYASNNAQSNNHLSSSGDVVASGPNSGPAPHGASNSTASLLVEAALSSVSNMIGNNVEENRNETEINIDSIPGDGNHNNQIQATMQSNIPTSIQDPQNPTLLGNNEIGSTIAENESSFNDIHDIENDVKLMNFQLSSNPGNESLQFPLSQHSSSSSTNGNNHNNTIMGSANQNNEMIPENEIDVDNASTPRTIDRTDSNGFRNYQATATPSPRDISPGQDYNQQHRAHLNSSNTSTMGQHQLFNAESPNLHRNPGSNSNFQHLSEQHDILGSSSPPLSNQPHPATSPPVIPRYGFTLNEICRKREFNQIHQNHINIQQQGGLNSDRRDHNLSSDDDSIVIAQNLSVTNVHSSANQANPDELLKLKMNPPPLDLIYSKYNEQLNQSSDLAELRMKYNSNETLDMPDHFQRNVGLASTSNSATANTGNEQINDIQGLDMSSRISGYPHHNFQLTAAAAAGLNRYHHHIYDILSERDQQQSQQHSHQQHHLQADHQLQLQHQEQQMMLDNSHQLSNAGIQDQDSSDQTTSVDLSRTASYVVTSPPAIPYASHPHSDMLRMVSLELNGANSNPGLSSNGGSNMIGTNNHRSFLSAAQHNPRMDTMESLHHHHHRLLTTAEQHRLLASNTAAAAEQLTNPTNHRLLVDPAHLIMESNNRNLLSASAETSRLLADSGVNHRHMVQSRDFGAYHHHQVANNYHHHPHHPLVRPSSLASPSPHHSAATTNYHHPFPTYY